MFGKGAVHTDSTNSNTLRVWRETDGNIDMRVESTRGLFVPFHVVLDDQEAELLAGELLTLLAFAPGGTRIIERVLLGVRASVAEVQRG